MKYLRSIMNYTNNISTNILRDQSVKIDYIATPNAKEIFDRMFLHNYGANKSFNLIGNYGTGKSTFLWALEKNLRKEKVFFQSLDELSKVREYRFIKLVGDNTSFSEGLAKTLRIHNATGSAILEKLEKIRVKASSHS